MRHRLRGFAGKADVDGLKGADGAAAGGFDARTNVGVECGTPFAAEAVVDFAQRDAGRPLAAIATEYLLMPPAMRLHPWRRRVDALESGGWRASTPLR